MANVKETLSRVVGLDGFVAAAVVDSNSGMMLEPRAEAQSTWKSLLPGNTEVICAKRKTMKALDLKESIDDMLITLHTQYHLIRQLSSNDALFLYLVLDKNKGNLAMAHHQLSAIEHELSV